MTFPAQVQRISESPPNRTKSAKKYDTLDFDDIEDDDLQSLVESSPYFTQATQVIAGPPTLKRQPPPPAPPFSSPPRIEVPASSPISATKKLALVPSRAGRLANTMAPAGTSFRSPARQIVPKKVETIYVPDSDDELHEPRYADSSDDGQPSRGNIQSTSFKRKSPPLTSSNVTTPAKTAALAGLSFHKNAENRVEASSKKLFEKLKRKFSLAECRAAAIDCGLDLDEAASFLQDRASLSGPSSQSSPAPSKSSASSAPPTKNRDVIDLLSEDESGATQAPQPKRRRLMQGRRRRSSPASSPLKLSQTQVMAPAQVVDLTTDDEDFQAEPLSPSSETHEDAFEERMLSYLNNCDKVQLMAIANIKEANAEAMLKHQPFEDLNAARRVTIPQKKGGKKTKAAALGEQIVDAIQEYASALDGIDHVIAACDVKAAAIRSATATWKLDVTGTNRAEMKQQEGHPMTPESLHGTSQLVELPIPREPSQMQGYCTMKSYQLYGLNWMYLLYERGFGGILADDMGLGKTCQVISLMCAIVNDWPETKADHEHRPWPNLIVVPPSTLANWEAEFQRFAPDINVISYCGPQVERDDIADEIMESPEAYHVILTTYTQLGRPEDIENLRRIRPMVAVFDEGHKMKNPKTKAYKDLLRIPATWRLLLTGTPVQNNLMEMIALLRFVEPSLFTDHFEDLEALFSQKVSLADVSKGALLFSERVARARTILEPFILQRRKEQVLTSLPAKRSRVILCELDKSQHDLYKTFERQFRKTDGPEAKAKGRVNDTNNVWMQLRKSAIHPQLFRRAFDDETVAKMAKILIRSVPQDELRQDNLGHLIDELKACSDFELHLWCRDYKCIRNFDLPEKSWTESAKVQKMLELVREYKKNGDRALIFTRFAKVIEILAECLASEGVAHLALQGNTDVGDRQDLINQFTANPSITVFLLTTGAGGTGINLVAANKVIVFDQSDNPQDDLQAENRAHRLGQTRDVEVLKLVSKDTIEELVHKACQKKLELANKVVGWEGGNTTMTSADMEATVRQELMAKENSPESTTSL